jgi:hypothetical protein
MAGNSYEAVLEAVERLPASDHLRLVSLLTDRLSRHVERPARRRSILELRGKGKEIWAGVDPDQYVDQERSSWNG